MTHRHCRVDVDQLRLDIASMARGLGYAPPAAVAEAEADTAQATAKRPMPPHMVEVVEAMLVRGRELIEPECMWVPVAIRINKQDDTLTCLADYTTAIPVGKLVRVQLRGSEAVAAFVITIGRRLETAAREMMSEGRSLEGYVLDTVGSMAVEAVADVLEQIIADDVAPRGWKITNRFSPGYCTWKTQGQHALFSLFPERPAGVSLSESSLMSPIKSISGIIGLGPSVEHRPYMCDICSMTTCHQRLTQARL